RTVTLDEREPFAHQSLFRLTGRLLLEEESARRARGHERVALAQKAQRLRVEVLQRARVEPGRGRTVFARRLARAERALARLADEGEQRFFVAEEDDASEHTFGLRQKLDFNFRDDAERALAPDE